MTVTTRSTYGGLAKVKIITTCIKRGDHPQTAERAIDLYERISKEINGPDACAMTIAFLKSEMPLSGKFVDDYVQFYNSTLKKGT